MSTEDGKALTKEQTPSLTNNIVHSMFQSVEMFINDIPITNTPDDYPYKAYISSVLTYPSSCKSTHLLTQGFYPDTAKHFGNVKGNNGAKKRNSLFRKNGDTVNDYKDTPVTLIGRVFHELMNINTGLPPGIKIRQFFTASLKIVALKVFCFM